MTTPQQLNILDELLNALVVRLAPKVAELVAERIQPEPDRGLKVTEVQRQLGCGINTVYRLVERGELKTFPIGAGNRNYRVFQSSVTAYMEKGGSIK